MSTGHILEVPAAECKFEPFLAPSRSQQLQPQPQTVETTLTPPPSNPVSIQALTAKAMEIENDPKTYGEAMSRADSHLWKIAIQEELHSME